MTTITDDYMKQRLGMAKSYSAVILHATQKRQEPGAEKIIWEHGRRNMSLQADGILSIVCPIRDESDVSGIGIFNADLEETRKIMDDDPGVKAGIIVYELHPCRGFPGSSLPG